jgi:2,3-bisphosphoglycerate-dependent phosphoglycerate mutase
MTQRHATLVLLRHGESTWNRENLFTGWTDVPLTDVGRNEATRAGEALRDAGITPDVLHTSLLQRAITTAHLALEACDRLWIPVQRTWRLNERHYGALQGLDKVQTSERYGAEQVFAWRRSYDVQPPALTLDDPRHPSHDARYAGIPAIELPATECLADVVTRMMPYWYDAISPQLMRGQTVLIAAHGNSLRALVKHLESVPDTDIADLNIPTGVPRVYHLQADLDVLSAEYLGDAAAIEAATAAVAQQAGPVH